MRAGLLRAPGCLEIVELETPRAREGEVVVRVRAALTCGTDLKAFQRGHPMWQMPMQFGHEFSGIVKEVGLGVSGVSEGDAVVAAPTGPCGSCRWCVRDQENLCETLMAEMVHGAYGEFVRLPARVVRCNLYPKPVAVSFAEAAFLEPLSCVVHGFEGSLVRPGDTAIVIGAGPIGLLHVAVLRARGVHDIRVVTRNQFRADAALALGADEVVASDVRDVVGQLRRDTGGGADFVVECTGRPEVWEVAPQIARRGGEVVLFGGCPQGTTVTLQTSMIHYDQVHLRSPFHFRPRDVRSAYEFIASRTLDLSPMLSGRRPLDTLEATLQDLQSGHGIKYVVEP